MNRQLYPGSIVKLGDSEFKVAYHVRSNKESQGYIVLEDGSEVFDNQVKVMRQGDVPEIYRV